MKCWATSSRQTSSLPSSWPVSTNSKAVARVFALLAACLILAGCAMEMPARPEQMAVASAPASVAQLGTVCVTVYGDDVGGFASHYYPLPRADFEAALLESMAAGGAFAPVARSADPDFLVTVGLIHLVAPQGSGHVTLETSWSVASAATGEEIARKSIRATTPASFFKKQEATEAAAQLNIAEGLSWLTAVVESHAG